MSSPEPSASFSTDKSHRAIWLSDPADANTAESVGCHSTLVTGSEWCLKMATGVLSLKRLRSQILTTPSSPPKNNYKCFHCAFKFLKGVMYIHFFFLVLSIELMCTLLF